jgi:uncharacterized protein
MNAFYFGLGPRRLFGIYTPAQGSGARQQAILMCNPWGQEYIRAHRSMRLLSGMLSAAGLHVMRFDYYGTGDSAGDPAETDLRGWESDIEMAIDELLDMTGVPRISLLGLRLGASLAASVSVKRRPQIDALVLWDPIVSGEEYLTELRHADANALARSAQEGGGFEVWGFALTDDLARELRAIDLVKLATEMPARVLPVVCQSLPSHLALSIVLSDRARETSLEVIASPPAWLEEGNSGAAAIPVLQLRRIVEFLT